MSRFQSVRHCFRLYILLTMAAHVKSSTHYIYVSANNSNCSDADYACLTISKVAAIATNVSSSDSNMTFILMPGKHLLRSSANITGLSHLSIKAGDSHVQPLINCGPLSKFHIHSIGRVHISGITFGECVENKVDIVNELIIEDCMFSGSIDGRALVVNRSTVMILNTNFLSFKKTTDKLNGGAIYCSWSDLLVLNSSFVDNDAQNGGAMYCLNSNVLIFNSTLVKNSAKRRGGGLYFDQNTDSSTEHSGIILLLSSQLQSYMKLLFTHIGYTLPNDTELNRIGTILCTGSNFTNNTAKSSGGAIRCEHNYSLHLNENNFTFNTANYGGVLNIRSSNIIIENSIFRNNKAHRYGGVGYCSKSTVLVDGSMFNNNHAGRHAGCLYFTRLTNASINSSKFNDNEAESIGGCLYASNGSLLLLIGENSFKRNSALYSAAINVHESHIVCNGSLHIMGNNGSVATAHSSGYFAGSLTFIDNNGSLYFFDSEIIISGFLSSTKHSHIKKDTDYTLEGGCLTFFISRVTISGTITLSSNMATNGGGLLSITSRIFIRKNGRLNITNNTATDSGGGVYLYLSELYVHGLVLIHDNRADACGGGMHCISSTVVVILQSKHSRSYVEFVNNSASSGGGTCLESSSKFYIKRSSGSESRSTSIKTVVYIGNRAENGGGIFVADSTTSGTCAGNTPQSVTAASQSECFIQILKPLISPSNNNYPHIGNYIFFSDNIASSSGATLYGGLLDRCTVNAFGRNLLYSEIPDSVNTIVNNTSSDPVRVCLCEQDNTSKVNYVCGTGHQTVKHINVMKGKIFTLKVVAVDQVNHTVDAVIHSLLAKQRGHLGDGQQVQRIEATCTDLNFSIFSPVKHLDHLHLYAEGPCNDLGISLLQVRVTFVPCECPLGFEPMDHIQDRCVCGCHHVLKRVFPFITNLDCDPETLLFTRNKNFWISTVNLTTFISYKECPSDYCHPTTTPVYIDFSTQGGVDVQCAFNRTGILCSSCHLNLSLSLGSSRCIECSYLWPATSVAIIVSAFIAGLLLVTVILAMNFTVATGTLNSMVFYANVLVANGKIYIPFQHPNLCSVIIAWMNLDVGFDVCFIKGLNAYFKSWLELVFPAYIILIVVAVVVASQYSRKFAKLIGHKNPIAALATLILLSYAKILHSTIGILSYAVLHYTPLDGGAPFTKVVWLRDGSVEYVKGAHVPLFLVAILILFLGFLYTFLLLSWQWLVRFPNKTVFCWLRNTKISSFIDAYHAPYTSRNRYWTGLLLLARVIIYLTAAINISGEPSVNLLAVSLVIGCIVLLHACSGVNVYKRWILNVVEFSTFFNLLAFTAAKFYVQQVTADHKPLAYISISVQIFIFICSLLHHTVVECQILLVDKIKLKKWYKNRFSRDLNVHLLDNQVKHLVPSQTVTFSEVNIRKSGLVHEQSETELEHERERTAMLSLN